MHTISWGQCSILYINVNNTGSIQGKHPCRPKLQVVFLPRILQYFTFQGLLIVVIMISVFGVLSAVPVSPDDSKIPGYPWLLLCRCCVGFGAAGVAQR